MTALRFPIEDETPQEHARHVLMFLGALKRLLESRPGGASLDEIEVCVAIERRATKIVDHLEQKGASR